MSNSEFIIRGKNLCKYIGPGGSVVIPKGITRIDQQAFQRSAVTDVVIPDTVTVIDELAFAQCEQLTEIRMPDSVETLGDLVFRKCPNLKTVRLSESLTEIPRYTFDECKALQDLEIPAGVRSIGAYAFNACESLTSVTIPDGVSAIAGSTFYHCRGLTSVRIPDSVRSIDGMAFSGCTSLTDISIPEHISTFGKFAFNDCQGLADENGFLILNHIFLQYFGDAAQVTVPEDVTEIADFAFCNKHALTDITLPDSLTTIGDSAFRQCENLTAIRIPSGVTTIKYWAFKECSGLTSVILPDGIGAVDMSPFDDCKKLTAIRMSQAAADNKEWKLGSNISVGIAVSGDKPRFFGFTSKGATNNYLGYIKPRDWHHYDLELINNGPKYKYKAPARLLGGLGRLLDPVDLTDECRQQHLEFLVKNAKKLIPIAEDLRCPAIVDAMISCGIVNDKNKKAIAKLLEASAVPEIAAIKL